MNFFIKQLLKNKLKGQVPDDQLDTFISVIEKNPTFFEKIMAEIQSKIAQGMDQQKASMEVMKTHEAELKELMK
ncbi:MAG: hypothetical protein V4481_01970 [Patescibacteria group bacterium]